MTFAQVATLCDKILLSTLLPLHWFGVYSLAVTVTITIQRLAPPFTNSYFPHFVRLLEQDRPDVLASAYRQASEFASAVFLAAGLSLVVYAGPIAQLLSTDPGGTDGLALVLALLAAANTLNVEMALPFSLLFAHGITAVALRINLPCACCIWRRWQYWCRATGSMPPPALWLAANALIAFPVLIAMTHRRCCRDRRGMAASHRPVTGLCRGVSCWRPGAAVMPDLSRAAGAGLDRTQWRACACGRIAVLPPRTPESSARA